jgi:hypothetical protein
MSAVSRGNYYKLRTKRWLEQKGYQVAFLERVLWIRKVPVKHDQFASDLLAMNEDSLIFVQVKLNRANVARAREEFRRHVFAPGAQRWIVVWEPRAREPDILDCTEDGQHWRKNGTHD